jgi:hypothetical protein
MAYISGVPVLPVLSAGERDRQMGGWERRRAPRSEG